MKVWPGLGIVLIQCFLCFAHWFIFHTWMSFWPLEPAGAHALAAALMVLSISFVAAALLGYRSSTLLVEIFYRIAAVWLGFLNFFFWAACLCWLVALVGSVTTGGLHGDARRVVAGILYGAAILTSLYGLANARRIRERRLMVQLEKLPATWRGRTALLISDIHLGHVNGAGFARRVAELAQHLNPDIVFIAGDLFDGSKADPDRLAGPLFTLAPPLGIYFCGGNHEDFGDADAYSAALSRGGMHVLQNRRVDVDGLRVIGVNYADTTYPMRLRSFLDGLHLDSGQASILLNHVPNRLPLVEHAGVSLQLSGHTHGGQMFPFTWITRRAFGKYTYGLQRFGKLQVLTSSGVGTWGPPMRVGTAPEVVLITFA